MKKVSSPCRESIKKVFVSISIIVITALALFCLFCPFDVDYEKIEEHIRVEENDGFLIVICDYSATSVDYLANSEGTRFVYLSSESDGRCYEQCIQISTNIWNLIFKTPAAIYKREITDYGALNGESIIIDNNENITTVPRYDVAIYYRDSDGTEHLIWSLE